MDSNTSDHGLIQKLTLWRGEGLFDIETPTLQKFGL